MKKLNVFVDESGHFDLYNKKSPYYLFSLVFHEENKSIEEDIKYLDYRLSQMGYEGHGVHSGEILRNEKGYVLVPPKDRKALFLRLFNFTRKVPIEFQSFDFEKKRFRGEDGEARMQAAMARSLSRFLRDNQMYFNFFDVVTVFYDNGQYQITNLLNTVFSIEVDNVKFKKVKPWDYRLFQVADMVCTIELLRLKRNAKTKSRTIENFFKPGTLKRTYIDGLEEKRFRPKE